MKQIDIEKFIRRQLDHLNENPEDDTWAQIARRQRSRNVWLKIQYFSRFALPIVAVAAIVIAFVWRPFTRNTPSTPEQSLPSITAPATLPMATLESAPAPESITRISTGGKRSVEFPKWYRQNNVPVDHIRFIAEKGVTYQSPVSGNSITIGPNKLVHADGKPVQGAVDLYFREYRTIPDMLAADIPMHYADERGNFFFNSGGMFDVRVSQTGQELFMAPGEVYDVNFAATKNLSNASLFYLNEGKSNWEYVSDKPFAAGMASEQVMGSVGLNIGVDEQAGANMATRNVFDIRTDVPAPLPPIVSEADVIQENTPEGSSACIPQLPSWPVQADPVSWVKESVNFGLGLTRGSRTIPVWFAKKPDGNDAYFASVLDKGDIRLVYGNDIEMRFFPQDESGIFTEFEAFKGCFFIRTSDSLAMDQDMATGEKSIDEIINSTPLWKSLTVQQDEGGKCFILLEHANGFLRVHAQLAKSSSDPGQHAFNPLPVFEKYHQLRKERFDRMNKELRSLRQFMATAPMFEEEKEWCMSKKEWLKYFSQNLPLMRARYERLHAGGMATNDELVRTRLDQWNATTRGLVLNRMGAIASKLNVGQRLSSMLRLSGFGTYNCDQIFALTNKPQYLIPDFKTPDGQVIVAANLRILDWNTRIFMTFPANGKALVLPGRPVDMMLTDKNGRIYFLAGKNYAQLPLEKQSQFTFVMEEVTDQVRSPMGWAELLSI